MSSANRNVANLNYYNSNANYNNRNGLNGKSISNLNKNLEALQNDYTVLPENYFTNTNYWLPTSDMLAFVTPSSDSSSNYDNNSGSGTGGVLIIILIVCVLCSLLAITGLLIYAVLNKTSRLYRFFFGVGREESIDVVSS